MSKFFPYREDPFSEGDKNSFDRVVSHESVSVSDDDEMVQSKDYITDMHRQIYLLVDVKAGAIFARVLSTIQSWSADCACELQRKR